MNRSTRRFSLPVLAVATVFFADPLSGAFAQEQMMPGMMNQGMMGPGMMGPGMMGPGMMGPGMMGPGMMGPGMMNQGMMGPGMMGMGAGCAAIGDNSMMGGMMRHSMMGHHMMDQGGGMMSGMMMGDGMGGSQLVMRPAPQALTVADVTYNLEQVLAMRGNARLKVGSVAEKDDATIVGDIVTTEGSLVERYEVDRRTGIARMVP